ncbi:beta-1,3-galactosyl-O-glycosyl-glycoprotein beta-1,6-N-acetylglucosaminyltransferase 4-like isoform X4 [Crassostrea virginica]
MMIIFTRLPRMNQRRRPLKLFIQLAFVIFVILFFNHMKARNMFIQSYDDHVSPENTKIVLKKDSYWTLKKRLNPRPERLVSEVNCQAIIEGDISHISYASKLLNRVDFKFVTDREMRKLAKNCDVFFKSFDYNRFTVTQEELDFPIAYSLITYKDAVQSEMLLRAIYRPHNAYCIHVDKSSSSDFFDAMEAVSKCLPNVFIASKLEDVIYEGYSRLQADINCMTDLLSYTNVNWKYLINLPAQEFPIKTNTETVKILKILNGTSSVESIYEKKLSHRRTSEMYIVNPWTLRVMGTGLPKKQPPFNVSIGKGSAYGAFSRNFVDFAVNDIKAREILKWTADTFSPDETFWATLAMNKHLGTPGINSIGEEHFTDRRTDGPTDAWSTGDQKHPLELSRQEMTQSFRDARSEAMDKYQRNMGLFRAKTQMSRTLCEECLCIWTWRST